MRPVRPQWVNGCPGPNQNPLVGTKSQFSSVGTLLPAGLGKRCAWKPKRAVNSDRMTTQAPERLRYNETEIALYGTPLCSYFAAGGPRPNFSRTSTMLWRGYVATWEILNNRLYLVDIKADVVGEGAATLETMFPGYPDRVFAHWYSGELRSSFGECLKRVNMGFGSTYAYDLLFDVVCGVVTSSRVHNNVSKQPPAGAWPRKGRRR